jgi:hypothetical protein
MNRHDLAARLHKLDREQLIALAAVALAGMTPNQLEQVASALDALEADLKE